MKRRDIEHRVSKVSGDFSAKVEGNPIAAFFVGIIVGVFLTITRSFVLPILIVAAVLGWVLWLLGDLDGDESTDAEFEDRDLQPATGSTATGSTSTGSTSTGSTPRPSPSESTSTEQVVAAKPKPESKPQAKAETGQIKEPEPLETYTPIKPSNDGKSAKAEKPTAKRSKKKQKDTPTGNEAAQDQSKVNGAVVNGTGAAGSEKSSSPKTGKKSSKSKSSKAKRKTAASTKKGSAKPDA